MFPAGCLLWGSLKEKLGGGGKGWFIGWRTWHRPFCTDFSSLQPGNYPLSLFPNIVTAWSHPPPRSNVGNIRIIYLPSIFLQKSKTLNQTVAGLGGVTHPILTMVLVWKFVFFFNREKLRHERILSSLSGNITTSHTIYPSFGRVEFFEFVLRNPYSTDQTVTIYCDDNELKYVNKRLVFNSYSLSQWIYTCVSLCK